MCAAAVERAWARGNVCAARRWCGLVWRRRVHSGLVHRCNGAAAWRVWVGVGVGRRCWTWRLGCRCIVCAAAVERAWARGNVCAARRWWPWRHRCRCIICAAAVERAWARGDVCAARRCWPWRHRSRCTYGAAAVERAWARGDVCAARPWRHRCRCIHGAAAVERAWARGDVCAARRWCGLVWRRRVHSGLVCRCNDAAAWRVWVGVGVGRRCWVVRLGCRCIKCAAAVEREWPHGVVVLAQCGCRRWWQARVWSGGRGCRMHGVERCRRRLRRRRRRRRRRLRCHRRREHEGRRWSLGRCQ